MAKKYISLKEAAKISGYSADYIGQLIRAGKLPGRQVYVNVAWMTTEDAVREYMHRRAEEKAGARSSDERFIDKFYAWRNRILMRERLMRIVTIVTSVVLGAALMLLMMMFYAYSVQIDKKLEENALRDAVESAPVVSPPPSADADGEAILRF